MRNLFVSPRIDSCYTSNSSITDTFLWTNKNILWRVLLLLNPPNSSIRDLALQAGHDINTSCFKIIHKLELNSINISEYIPIKKFSPDLNNQNASTKLNILG